MATDLADRAASGRCVVMAARKRKQHGESQHVLSFQDDLEDEPGSFLSEERKMRNPAVQAPPSRRISEEDKRLAVKKVLAEPLELSIRVINETTGNRVVALSCTQGDSVDVILGRVAAILCSSSDSTVQLCSTEHSLMLAVDHWIVSTDITLYALLHREWTEGEHRNNPE